ncbi:MAG: hypothetical protein IPK83_13505 [Planctomycetes bacterium]|nr:hypothetical protein [Planctomycetota bacterium]
MPPLRGRILDRFGRPLVSDAPACDVSIHYGVLSMDGADVTDEETGGEVQLSKKAVARMKNSYIEQLALKLRRSEPALKGITSEQAKQEVIERIARMWITLEKRSGTPLPLMNRRRKAICSRIESLRRYIWNARNNSESDDALAQIRLREDHQFHSILRDISPEVRTQLEVELAGMPFVRIEPSVRRVWSESAGSLSHAMGTLGQVSAERMENDDRAEDWLGCYRPGDEAGVSGVEYLCENMLRGRRGI